METHRSIVEELQKKMSAGSFKKSGSSEMSHTMRQKNYTSIVNSLRLKDLKNVLEVNTGEKYIVVEPGITMEELVDATLPFNLIPPVIPEFKGITVGGAINGAAIESSSHHFGQFNDICLEYEVLTPGGEILHASPKDHSDLFYAIGGSFGTLGILLSVKIRLIHAKPWVKLTYQKFKTPSKAIDFLNELHEKPSFPDFMEGIVYGKDKTVVIFGQLAEHHGGLPTNKISHYADNWFYAHADTILEEHYEEVIPLKDYLFRHDRGAFWMGGYGLHPKMFFKYLMHKLGAFKNSKWLHPHFCTPKNPGPFFRNLFGWLMGSGNLYKSLHNKSEEWFKRHFIIQDFYLPKAGVNDFIDHILDTYKITPLWICPVRTTKTKQLFSPHYNPSLSLLFDVGVYGIPCQADAEEVVNSLENLMHESNGKKMFYCATFIPKTKFWVIYPESEYRSLRKKYAAESLPDITDKVLIR